MRIPSKARPALALAIIGATLLLSGCGLFSQELRTEIPIESSAESVWGVLTDFEQFPQWNPMIREVKGEAAMGSTLSVFIQPEGGKGMAFTPTVLKAEPNRELRWRGKLGVRGIFDGEHIFAIIPTGADTIVFVHREEFSGLLIPIIMPFIQKDTQRGFNEMNVALKKRVESFE